MSIHDVNYTNSLQRTIVITDKSLVNYFPSYFIVFQLFSNFLCVLKSISFKIQSECFMLSWTSSIAFLAESIWEQVTQFAICDTPLIQTFKLVLF